MKKKKIQREKHSREFWLYIQLYPGGYRSPRWENIPRYHSSWDYPAKVDAGIAPSHPRPLSKRPPLYSPCCRHINNAHERTPSCHENRAERAYRSSRERVRCACFESTIKLDTRFLNLSGIGTNRKIDRKKRSFIVRIVSMIVRELNAERIVYDS